MLNHLHFGREGFNVLPLVFVDVASDIVGQAVLARDAVVVDDDHLFEEIGRSSRQYGLDADGDPIVRFVLTRHDDTDGGEHGFVEAIVAAHGVEEGFDAFALVHVPAFS